MAMMEKKDKPEEEKNRVGNLARYSAMGFQMFAIMGLAAWGGVRLDKLVHWNFPVFTFVLTITGVALSIFYFVRDAGEINRKNQKPPHRS
jgi:ATP synthase protein I